MLEPCALKGASTVLRGLGASNGPWLPDRAPNAKSVSSLWRVWHRKARCKAGQQVSFTLARLSQFEHENKTVLHCFYSDIAGSMQSAK